jgi:hypothetical protein
VESCLLIFWDLDRGNWSGSVAFTSKRWFKHYDNTASAGIRKPAGIRRMRPKMAAMLAVVATKVCRNRIGPYGPGRTRSQQNPAWK